MRRIRPRPSATSTRTHPRPVRTAPARTSSGSRDVPPHVTQQTEIHEIVVTREEHRAYAYWCEGCGKIHYAELPEAVRKEGLFKARLTALVAYMKNVCHASFSTIRKFLRDVVGETVSRGYLVKLITKVSRSLERPYQELLERIPLEASLNVDETGHKDNGDRFWTWVFKADLYVLFRIDKSRGSQVLIEVFEEEIEGTLGCDYFSAYRKFIEGASRCRPPGTAPKPLRILDSAGNRQGQSGESPTSMRSHLPPGILAPRPMSLRQSCSWA